MISIIKQMFVFGYSFELVLRAISVMQIVVEEKRCTPIKIPNRYHKWYGFRFIKNRGLIATQLTAQTTQNEAA